MLKLLRTSLYSLLVLSSVMVLPVQAQGKNKAADARQEAWAADDKIVALPGLKVNYTKKEFVGFGFVRQRQGPIELLACSPGSDKVHEVIVQVACNPIDFHMAMTFIGFKHGKPAATDDQGGYTLPEGPRAIIYLEWDDSSGKTQRYRFEDLLLNVRTGKTMRRNGWVFTGSIFRKNEHTGKRVFLANEVKTLIATYHDATSILDNPSITGRDDSLFQGNPKLLPETGTKIRILVTHPTEADKKQWAKWKADGDDESSLFLKSDDPGTPVDIKQRWEGLFSDYDDAYFPPPIRDKKYFKEIWTRLYAGEKEKPPLPKIDFKRDMLLTLVGGAHPTTGYATRARAVFLLGDEYVVKFEDIEPKVNDKVEKKSISPWELIVLPRRESLVQWRSIKRLEPSVHFSIEEWEGENARIAKNTLVIKNKNDWADQWRKFFGNRTVTPSLPDINFNQHMVLAVFAGPQLNQGAEIYIDQLEKNADELIVSYTLIKAIGKPAKTPYGPFHVMLTQKTEKPIVFELTED